MSENKKNENPYPKTVSLDYLREKELQSDSEEYTEPSLDSEVELDFEATFEREYEPSLEDQLGALLDDAETPSDEQ